MVKRPEATQPKAAAPKPPGPNAGAKGADLPRAKTAMKVGGAMAATPEVGEAVLPGPGADLTAFTSAMIKLEAVASLHLGAEVQPQLRQGRAAFAAIAAGEPVSTEYRAALERLAEVARHAIFFDPMGEEKLDHLQAIVKAEAQIKLLGSALEGQAGPGLVVPTTREEKLEAALKQTYEALTALHDQVSDMVENDRLTKEMVPNDYPWLVETLTDRCLEAERAAQLALGPDLLGRPDWWEGCVADLTYHHEFVSVGADHDGSHLGRAVQLVGGVERIERVLLQSEGVQVSVEYLKEVAGETSLLHEASYGWPVTVGQDSADRINAWFEANDLAVAKTQGAARKIFGKDAARIKEVRSDGSNFKTTYAVDKLMEEEGFKLGPTCFNQPRAASRDASYIAKWERIDREDYPKIEAVVFCDDPRNGTLAHIAYRNQE